MSTLFLLLALANLVPTIFTGSLPNLAVGAALLLLSVAWACGEAGEAECDADEA
jgi:hypothetical protein